MKRVAVRDGPVAAQSVSVPGVGGECLCWGFAITRSASPWWYTGEKKAEGECIDSHHINPW